MKSVRLTIITVSVILLVLLASCGQKAPLKREEAFQRLILIKDMNTKIRFEKPESLNEDFRINENIFLSLENLTSEKVGFENDFGIKIYTYENNTGEWREIPNQGVYSGAPVLFPKGPDSPGVIGVNLWPKINIDAKPAQIRILVVGNLFQGDKPTNERVGAYTDVTLQP